MNLESFVYEASPTRVVFGTGTITRIAEEAKKLHSSRALVITTSQQEDLGNQVLSLLSNGNARLFSGAMMHTPIEVTTRALDVAQKTNADLLIAVGGGSTTGLTKALSRRLALPQIVIPTTYAGSEMTPILGETEGRDKKTIRDAAILPATVIYDVNLTLTLPAPLSANSGLNAIAHAVEALYAPDANPIIRMFAKEAIRVLSTSLPRIVADESDREARAHALYGAWLAGTCLGAASMSMHHKLCHTLGGIFGLPHAETHAVMLPHVFAFVASAVPAAVVAVANSLDTEDAVSGLFDLARRLRAPSSLRELGMPQDGIFRAAKAALDNPYGYPRPVDLQQMMGLLERTYEGVR